MLRAHVQNWLLKQSKTLVGMNITNVSTKFASCQANFNAFHYVIWSERFIAEFKASFKGKKQKQKTKQNKTKQTPQKAFTLCIGYTWVSIRGILFFNFASCEPLIYSNIITYYFVKLQTIEFEVLWNHVSASVIYLNSNKYCIAGYNGFILY